MKKRRYDTAFTRTLAVLLVLLGIVLLANRGLDIHSSPSQLSNFIQEQSPHAPLQETEVTLITQGETALLGTVKETLDQMKIGWSEVSAAQYASQSQIEGRTVLICTPGLSAMDSEALAALITWVENGGRLALMAAPEIAPWFEIIRQKLGIIDDARGYHQYSSMRFMNHLLPMMDDQVFADNLLDFALAVHLDPSCDVYLETADTAKVPLLWARDLGSGRIAVNNSSRIQGKDTRGSVRSVLSILEEALVYPIVNTGMVYIDDFPAPQPLGTDKRLREQFGFDIQGFFRNHWWPDMKGLTWKYGLRYTGVLIETYNDRVQPPFEPENDGRALIRYYLSELLKSGGEVGLHGYNHQPLVPEGFDYSGDNYTGWPEKGDMILSIQELLRYGKSFLPDAQFLTYLPPSNYLSPTGQEALLEAVPELRVISGLYLPEGGVKAHVQEFQEEHTGLISIPRITSGYSMNSYNLLMVAHELALHGVFSHFIHPDDVLDDARGAMLGWASMFRDFETVIESMAGTYPALRWNTAAQGAAAIQRYDRLAVKREMAGKEMNLTLSPFYDEAWLALWCVQEPIAVENAELHKIDEGFYWLHAHDAQVRIRWENSL